ncbi:MAG: helix-hairpin-helix domain-containing protein [Leptospiraceae bacterium]|nr:pathogenicity locus [Leptospiraceae bacterium]MCK6381544.1 helix-hairpin-helix domain-containing protein [Leptospiraceae bacterium]NUM42696.1 pathogenicity locus [Leptospiraceae bacterium]
MNAKYESLKDLMQIPGVGKSIAQDLYDIGIRKIEDLKNKEPEVLYKDSNDFSGMTQDRCLLYVFRCACYFAKTPEKKRVSEKLQWWYWKDKKQSSK